MNQISSMKRIGVLEEPFSQTPVYRLSGIDTDNEIYIKRDDLIPFSFGGNKARKAAEFYREIQRLQPDHLMTYGSNSSNHCRIIANMAAAMRLPCHIISSTETVEGKGGKELYNSILVKSFGATVEQVPVSEVAATIEKRLQEGRERGESPYFIQGGGHGNPGTEGYVKCYNEIREQEKEMGLSVSKIFHASGTGTTQAGLICGRILEREQDLSISQKEQPEIIGISIARPCPRGAEVVRESVLEYLGETAVTGVTPEERLRPEDLTFDDHFRCGGYGQYDDHITETIATVMNQNGIPMDTTYVGKAFTGMLDYLKAHDIHGEQILFIHTGGTPLYFDAI